MICPRCSMKMICDEQGRPYCYPCAQEAPGPNRLPTQERREVVGPPEAIVRDLRERVWRLESAVEDLRRRVLP